MSEFVYLIRYANGHEETARVRARDVNAGFAKALRIAREPLGNGKRRAIASLTFVEEV